MKRPPVLKLEESGTDSFGNKVYELKLNGKALIKDYSIDSESRVYYSDDNFMLDPVLSDTDLSAIACLEIPERVEFTVSLSLELFNTRTCKVDVLRKGNKLHLVYDICFSTEANKSFIWSEYWFTMFLREHFMRSPYKLDIQPGIGEMEGELVVALKRTVLCDGRLGELFKSDIKYFAAAVEKTHQRLLVEARKFKTRSVTNQRVRKGKTQQISGNSPDNPQILPSIHTPFTS